MQRGILQELRGRPFHPRVRRLAKLSVELFDQSRLPDAGFADHEDKLPLPRTRALPAPTESIKLLLASDEWRQRARPAPPAPAARPYESVKRQRRWSAFELMHATIFRDKKPGNLALH